MKKKLFIMACILTLGAVAVAWWLFEFWGDMGDYSWDDEATEVGNEFSSQHYAHP